jgi:hypothetical protein
MKMNNVVVRNANLVVNTDVEKVEEEELEFAIVFDIDEERMFYLNNTSYEIFKIAEVQISTQEIVDHFKENYSVTSDDIESINQVILDMLDKNILLHAVKE